MGRVSKFVLRTAVAKFLGGMKCWTIYSYTRSELASLALSLYVCGGV